MWEIITKLFPIIFLYIKLFTIINLIYISKKYFIIILFKNLSLNTNFKQWNSLAKIKIKKYVILNINKIYDNHVKIVKAK